MSYQFAHRLTFGCVQYINALPFSLFMIGQSSVLTTLAAPSQLLDMLVQQSVDLALTSSIGSWHPAHTRHSFLGIAAHRHVHSVNLYATPHFFSRPSRVAVSQDSKSSSMLLRILSRHVWQQSRHQYIPVPAQNIPFLSAQDYDALLLIGDLALKHPNISSFHRYDLASEWYQWKQLPFVFATLLALENNPKSKQLLPFLEEALALFEEDPQYQQAVCHTAHQHTDIPLPVLDEYYSSLQYRFTEEHFESLALFKEYATYESKNASYSEYV